MLIMKQDMSGRVASGKRAVEVESSESASKRFRR